tara:strand:+ start:95 stop:583 length:489 start_codon:yes stop_codon:yes gene_type:complete
MAPRDVRRRIEYAMEEKKLPHNMSISELKTAVGALKNIPEKYKNNKKFKTKVEFFKYLEKTHPNMRNILIKIYKNVHENEKFSPLTNEEIRKIRLATLQSMNRVTYYPNAYANEQNKRAREMLHKSQKNYYAKEIQNQTRESLANPKYRMCRSRLMREFDKL